MQWGVAEKGVRRENGGNSAMVVGGIDTPALAEIWPFEISPIWAK